MRAHMLSMLSLTPPTPPIAHQWSEMPAAPARSRAKASLKPGRPALPRPLSLSKLLHKTALLLHP
ncbi:MAG TPA: hypothetical protein V6D05_15480 [Stenomitos sp.]